MSPWKGTVVWSKKNKHFLDSQLCQKTGIIQRLLRSLWIILWIYLNWSTIKIPALTLLKVSKGKFTKNIMMWQTWSSRRYNCIVWLSAWSLRFACTNLTKCHFIIRNDSVNTKNYCTIWKILKETYIIKWWCPIFGGHFRPPYTT